MVSCLYVLGNITTVRLANVRHHVVTEFSFLRFKRLLMTCSQHLACMQHRVVTQSARCTLQPRTHSFYNRTCVPSDPPTRGAHPHLGVPWAPVFRSHA